MIGTVGAKAAKGVSMFKTGRKAGKAPAMLKTKWYDPKLGNIEYLTPQGKRAVTRWS